jgi:hypothetical protein
MDKPIRNETRDKGDWNKSQDIIIAEKMSTYILLSGMDFWGLGFHQSRNMLATRPIDNIVSSFWIQEALAQWSIKSLILKGNCAIVES